MELKNILQADYLDIVFDKHNKRYGGYELRRSYNSRFGKGILLMFSGIAALVLVSFVTAGNKPAVHIRANTDTVRFTDLTSKVELPKPVIPETPPPPAASHPNTKVLTPPVITNEPVPPGKEMTPNEDMKNAMPGTTHNDGNPGDMTPPATGTGRTTSVITPPPAVPDKPLLVAAQMPQFIGDMEGFLAARLQYPDMAREANIQGRVLVRFVVAEDGTVSDATVVRGIGGGCDEEALRVVRAMPRWKPGKQNGVPVKVYFTVPIKFLIQ